MASNRCSMCQKEEGSCICGGCKACFCVKHFNEHRRELLNKFDHDVGVELNKLLEEINKPKPSTNSSADLLRQIDRWETTTVEKIHQAAEEARRKLTELMNLQKNRLKNQFKSLKEEIDKWREEENFVESDIKRLKEEINQLQRSLEVQTRPSEIKIIVRENSQIEWNRLIYVEETAWPQATHSFIDTMWSQNGIIVAGGNGMGAGLNQLSRSLGLYVDDDQTVYIADQSNDRIVEWQCGATVGQVVAGGNGRGSRTDQLSKPTDVIVDKQTDSLIICDRGNRRVVRWPRRGGTSGQQIISNIQCYGLMMDDDGFLYVSDDEKHEVRRWGEGETRGTVVAGGNGKGDRLDQLNFPLYVFIDQDHSVYVSDQNNARVMKWVKDAKEGIVVTGGGDEEDSLTRFSGPQGVIVDELGTVYVADFDNHRIMCWPKGTKQGSIVVVGNSQSGPANQLISPTGLSFDRHGNLYVVDYDNHQVQKFPIKRRL